MHDIGVKAQALIWYHRILRYQDVTSRNPRYLENHAVQSSWSPIMLTRILCSCVIIVTVRVSALYLFHTFGYICLFYLLPPHIHKSQTLFNIFAHVAEIEFFGHVGLPGFKNIFNLSNVLDILVKNGVRKNDWTLRQYVNVVWI